MTDHILILRLTHTQLDALHDRIQGGVEDAKCAVDPESAESVEVFAGDLSLEPIVDALDAHRARLADPTIPAPTLVELWSRSDRPS